MSELLPFVIVGMITGSLYGLAGVGLVLTFRTSGIFNFAAGSIAAAAAYTFYELHVEHGMAWPLAGAIILVAFGLIGGLAMERIVRSLAGASQVAVIVLTVGLMLGIQGILFIVFGSVAKSFPEFLPTDGFVWSGVFITWGRVIAAVLALIATVGLYLYLRFSRTGMLMRAVVENPTVVTLTGVQPVRVQRVAWAIGTSFAAASGMMLAPTLGLDATLLTFLVLQSLGAGAIGRFKSLPATYAGGLLVGVAASLATRYLDARPWSGIPPTIPFMVLVVVLVLVPAKKFPTPMASLRSVVAQRALPSLRSTGLVAIAGIGVLTVAPFVVGTYLPLWTNALTLAILFGSLGLLVWGSGQISLCQLAFAAIGATTCGHLTGAGVPWLFALLLAGLIAMPIGALVAIPAIRVSGIYLALVTIGFGILMQSVGYTSDLMFGAETEVRGTRPVLGPIDAASSDRWFYFVVLAVAVASFAILVAVQRGQLGQLLRAMGERPMMLTTHGLSVTVAKVLVFSLSAFLAAISGGLVISQAGTVRSETFTPLASLILVAVLAISGTDTIRAPWFAAALYGLAPGYIESLDQDTQLLGFGSLAVLAGLLIANRSQLTAWFSRANAASDERASHSPVRARTRAAALRVPVEVGES